MASEMLGRAKCPECGFESAHVKIKTDKDGAKPYRHCPECGAQYFPRSVTQADNLRAQIKAAKVDTPAPEKTPEKVPEVAPEKATKFLFGVRVPA